MSVFLLTHNDTVASHGRARAMPLPMSDARRMRRWPTTQDLCPWRGELGPGEVLERGPGRVWIGGPGRARNEPIPPKPLPSRSERGDSNLCTGRVGQEGHNSLWSHGAEAYPGAALGALCDIL